MTMGLAAATVGVYAIWGLSGLLLQAAKEGGNPKQGAFLTLLAFLIKIPAFLLLFALSQRIGNPAPACYIAGIVVVYSASVVWGMTR
jgi:hypothetical protein